MSKFKYTDEEFIKAVTESLSIASVCRTLGMRPSGGNYRTVHSKIESLSLNTSHFTGSAWNVGINFKPIKTKIPLSDIMVEKSSYKSTTSLKKRLFEEGYKEERCELCGNTEWMGNPIPLEIHHINGINTDNRLENLSIICCNCHAITPNYRGKSKAVSALSEMRDVEYRKVKECLHSNVEVNLEPTSSVMEEGECAETRHGRPKSKPKICPNCLTEFRGRNVYCSSECYISASKGKRPNVLELIDKFKELKNFVQVGKYYEVSDNAVRKWCEFYGILDMVKE